MELAKSASSMAVYQEQDLDCVITITTTQDPVTLMFRVESISIVHNGKIVDNQHPPIYHGTNEQHMVEIALATAKEFVKELPR
jgi:hypothetical protein